MHDSKRTFFKKSTLLWVVPAAVLAVLGYVWYVSQSSLNAQLAALRAQGLPTNGDELNEYYAVPEGVVDTTDLWMAAFDAVEAANIHERGKSLPFVGGFQAPVPAPGEAWAEVEAARTFLTELRGELKIIHQAADVGGQARFPIDCYQTIVKQYLPHTQHAWSVAALLQLDAHLAVHDGSDSRVLEDVTAIFALSDALCGEPRIRAQQGRLNLHAIGCDTVASLMPHCNWSDMELESLQRAVQEARFKDEVSRALCGERAVHVSRYDQLPLWLRYSTTQARLQIFASSLEGLSSSWPDALRRQREVSAHIESLQRRRGFTAVRVMYAWMFLPNLERAVVETARAHARQECTNAAIAAWRYQLEFGQLPESLSDIEQRLLGPASELPAKQIDPFVGKPLRYKVEETRVLIYSVGENARDDGGDFDHDTQGLRIDIGLSLSRGREWDNGR